MTVSPVPSRPENPLATRPSETNPSVPAPTAADAPPEAAPARPPDPAAAVETARWFLAEVFRGVSDGAMALNYLGPRPGRDGRRPFLTAWHDPADVPAAAAHAVALSARSCVWYGVGVRGGRSAGRGGSADVVAVTGLWADVDVAHPVHAKKNLPPTSTDALLLIGDVGVEPTIVVDSGHGLQAHWLFPEPWLLATDDDRRAAQDLSNAFKVTLRRHAAARGWAVDSVADLARVMRVPGTSNRKEPDDVRPVTVHTADGERCGIEDLRAVLLPHAPAAAVATVTVPDDVPDFGEATADLPDLGPTRGDDVPSLDDEPEADEPAEGDEGKPAGLTDDELLDRARRARNGPAFDALYRGSLDAHGGDHSAADQALINRLLWWCAGDRDRADRLFRRSGQMRAKWDEVHDGDGRTYGA
ncbi:MAG TPA: hypothetical protein VF796_21935, partial [Humisphaera sp.]